LTGNVHIYITRGEVILEIITPSGSISVSLEAWEVDELIRSLAEAAQISREGLH